MALFYVICSKCNEPDRRVLEPEQMKKATCRKCGGKVKRTPKPPTAMLKEVIDNGLMMKRHENFVDGQKLTKERSTMDFSRPDWQRKDE